MIAPSSSWNTLCFYDDKFSGYIKTSARRRVRGDTRILEGRMGPTHAAGVSSCELPPRLLINLLAHLFDLRGFFFLKTLHIFFLELISFVSSTEKKVRCFLLKSNISSRSFYPSLVRFRTKFSSKILEKWIHLRCISLCTKQQPPPRGSITCKRDFKLSTSLW
jgi:hypothetical protein